MREKTQVAQKLFFAFTLIILMQQMPFHQYILLKQKKEIKLTWNQQHVNIT